MQKITPYLWFENEAEEAANFYTSVFKDSRVLSVDRFGDGGPGESGSVIAVGFEINGQQFVGLNGRPGFDFNESVSFMVSCDSQDEVDYHWDRLLEGGGQESQCGWLKDKYGVSWQIIPTELLTLLQDPDPERAQRAMQAMLAMSKIDIDAMRQAAAGS